jgi:AcrR family transcriptional regulator
MDGNTDGLAQQFSKSRRHGGRAAEVVAAVHAATLALLAEVGYERMEIPTIAERAAVNKTSIYRRWPSKAELVMDVALAQMQGEVPLPDMASLHGNIEALLRTIAAALATPFASGLLRAFISRELEAGAAEARTRFWNERFRISGAVLTRAIARGELPATCDTRLMMEMAVAPLFFRALATGEPITDPEIAAIAARVIAAFQVP